MEMLTSITGHTASKVVQDPDLGLDLQVSHQSSATAAWARQHTVAQASSQIKHMILAAALEKYAVRSDQHFRVQIAMDEGAWSLSAEERAATVDRITKNISSIAFFKGHEISDADARAAAVAAEKKAYTAAQVAARTTTGNRPHAETTSGYARKLGELVLTAVAEAGKGPAASNANGATDVLDLSGGSRDFLDAETARSVLAPLLAAGAAHTQVRFSTKSFGLEAAQVAAEALKAVASSLTHADMSDIIAGRPEDEALEALRIISAALSTAQLKHLNLSDNALGEKGLRAAAAAVQNPGLEFMSLQNVGCSVHACKALSELVPAGSALSGLHLYNNMTGDEGAEHVARLLSRCPGFTELKLASSRVGPAGGISIAKALSAGTSLVKLDLSDNPLTEEVAQELAACLAMQPNLMHLNLNDTGLTDDGIEAVCKALAAPGAAAQLESLELALNEITPAGMRYVVMAIANKPKLTKLNLRENELETEGAVTLARGLTALPALKVLDLCCNQITRSGALAVARAVAKAKAPLELLALDENAISEDGIPQLKQVLKDSFGSDSMLGPLDENDPDMAESEGGDAGEAMDADDDLTAAMARTHI